MTDRRRRALRRRRIFISLCVVILVAAIAAIGILISSIIKSVGGKDNNTSSLPLSEDTSSTEPVDEYAGEDLVVRGDYTLDANYSRLLLVNSEYPLPEDYNYGWNLTKIEEKYHNGQLDRIDAGVWPYMKAMIEAAWKDNVKLYVWSPYRSYDTQKMLFENRVKKEGGDEAKAATAVARPGTSEHNTGLCADFNMASSQFESTEMFTWMCAHAEDYGFILRYPNDKIDITGVMYESWHWRFVGINRAKEINKLGITLEEYIKLKNIEPQSGLYEK